MSERQVEYKIVLSGDAGVGKTAILTRYLTGNFVQQYIPTEGFESRSHLRFQTNRGTYVLDIWDLPGQEKLSTPDMKFDGSILMFDLSCKNSYENVQSWYNKLLNCCPDGTVVLCGNKYDSKYKRVKPEEIDSQDLQYYNISSRTGYNVEKPFLYLLRQLSGYQDLEIV